MQANKKGCQIEFKKTTRQLDRGMETLCAFHNGTGGTLMFGITDKGEIISQEVSDKTKRVIKKQDLFQNEIEKQSSNQQNSRDDRKILSASNM